MADDPLPPTDDECFVEPIQRASQACENCRAKGIVDLNDGEAQVLPHVTQGSPSLNSTPPSGTIQFTSELEIPNEIREEGILLYFRHFHNQPYPLMMGTGEDPRASANDYPKIVLLPLLAVSLRTSQSPFFHDKEAIADTCGMLAEAAWNLLTAQYATFNFDLAYFQALCLLAQVDFATGKPHRAQAQVALGLRLAQTRGLLSEETTTRPSEHQLSLDWRSVVWTLFMMDRTFSGARVRSSCVPTSSFQLFLMQRAPPNPDGSSRSENITLSTCHGNILQGGSLDVGSCNIVLLDLWHGALMAVFGEGSSKPGPFWRNDSAQASIETRLMEFELRIHPHRYTVVGSPRRVLNEPDLRPFFTAWVFMQILYSAIRCCLHHPFVLFMNTRHHHNQVPLTTLQNAHHNSIIHSSWVIRHIIEMEGAGMSIYDPFIGYLVALAASIQLEHTLNNDPKVANAARLNVGNSLSILDEISIRLHRRRTISYGESEYDGAIPSKELSDVNVNQEDIDLMAKLFDYAAISDEQQVANPPGTSSTTSQSRPQASDSTSNLVPHDTIPASADLTEIGTQLVRPDPLAGPGELDWSNEVFDISADFTNDWSFLGQRWSTHFPEGSR
ncbi:hypothetical protein CC79DRAFT_1372259 [Sarocladium strictum]